MKTLGLITSARTAKPAIRWGALPLACGLLLAALLLAALGGLAPWQQGAAGRAYAETYTGTAILKNETDIERTTNAYKDVEAELDAVNAQIAELQVQIDELKALIPVQQARSDRALKYRYKSQKEPLAILEVLFESQSLDDFLRQSEYIQRISRASLEEINRTRNMKAQLNSARDEQQRIKGEIDARMDAVRAELATLQAMRASRQASGVASAVGQAGSLGGEASVGLAADGGEQPEDYREAATANTGALNDGADWYADRDEFIQHWAERIDRYLAGSPLEGQGVNFAQAAWKYNVDPRWSPAISNTESSKGAHCIRPHNAWGWGAADSDPYNLALDWPTWEDAIDAHVKGLSEGYGYTITMNGARAYCPNTWQSWYNRTLSEMATI